MNSATCPVDTSIEIKDAYELTAVSANEALENKALVAEWRNVQNSDRVQYTIFMSPEWIAHASRLRDNPIKIWLARNMQGELVGVVPVAPREFKLTFDVANRVLRKKTLRVAEVLGSQPCVPDSSPLLRDLFRSILDAWPDCDGILMDALPSSSYCSRSICSKDALLPGFVYSPFDQRPSIVVPIVASFDEYMSSKSAKTRSTLRRKVRAFTDSGAMRLSRYSQPSEVREFINGLSRISARTWQQRILGLQYHNDDETIAKFTDLANRGLLRSYLLWRDGQPFAFIVGYQYDGVYYYADVGFDPQAAVLSPGTVLLFLILEDLHSVDPPNILNFGVGDAAYKQRFGKTIGNDETILLLRSGFRNRSLILSHQVFMNALDCVKRVIGRRVQK